MNAGTEFKKREFDLVRPSVIRLLKSWHETWKKHTANNGMGRSVVVFGCDVFGYNPNGSKNFREFFIKQGSPSYKTALALPGHAIITIKSRLDSVKKLNVEAEAQRKLVIHAHVGLPQIKHLLDLISMLAPIDPAKAVRTKDQLKQVLGEESTILDPLEKGILQEVPGLEPPQQVWSGGSLRVLLHSAAPSPVSYFRGQQERLQKLREFCDRKAGPSRLVIHGKEGKTQLVLKLIEAENREKAPPFTGGIGYVNMRDFRNVTTIEGRIANAMSRIMNDCEGSDYVRDQFDLGMQEGVFKTFMADHFGGDRPVLLVVDNITCLMEFEKMSNWLEEGSQSRVVFVHTGQNVLEFLVAARSVPVEDLQLDGRLGGVDESMASMEIRFGSAIQSGLIPRKQLAVHAKASKGDIRMLNHLSVHLSNQLYASGRSVLGHKIPPVLKQESRGAGNITRDEGEEPWLIALAPDACAWLRPLSVFRGGFTASMAAELMKACEVPTTASEVGRRLLEEYHQSFGVLAHNQDTRLFRIEDDFLRERLVEQMPAARLEQAMTAYCDVQIRRLKDLERRYTGGPTHPYGLSGPRGRSYRETRETALEFQRHVLNDALAALRWMGSKGRYDPAATKRFRKILVAAPTLLTEFLTGTQLLEIGNVALEYLDPKEDFHEICVAKGFLAKSFYRRGYFSISRTLSKDRKVLARKLLSSRTFDRTRASELLVDACWDFGRSDMQMDLRFGRRPNIRSFLEAEREIGKLKGSRQEIYWGCQNDAHVGWAMMQAGNFQDAVSRFTKALETAPSVGAFNVAGRCRVYLGVVQRQQAFQHGSKRKELMRDAQFACVSALNYVEQLGNPLLIGLANRSMSRVSEALGDLEKAIEHEEVWYRWKAANGHIHLGQTLDRINRLKELAGIA